MKRVYQFAIASVKVICLLLAAVLFVSGFFWTCYAQDMSSQVVLTGQDNIMIHLLSTVGILIAAGYVCKWVSKAPGKRNKILLFTVLGWYLTMGLVLVFFGRTVPAADASSVFFAAQDLARGSTEVIQGAGSYLSFYPHQIGLVAYFEPLIRVWDLFSIDMMAYHAIKCINVLWACILICFQYRTVQMFFHQDRADTVYLLIMLFHFPLLMYTSFVYGEVPSIALFSVGLWALLKLLDMLSEGKSSGTGDGGRKPFICMKFAIVSTVAFAGSVMLRKNALILMIAVIIVVLFEALRYKRILLLCMAVLYAVVSFGILPATVRIYEYRAGNRLLSGVTPMSYLAMGMQESQRADGWYNGFNIETYMKAGMDGEIADRISREAIGERLTYFRQHPGYAAAFYSEKFLSQWADGTYASRQATLATYGGRAAFFQELYEGRYSGIYIEICNILQNFIYLGAFVFCINSFRQKKDGIAEFGLPVYICFIGVFGGCLFHMLWEANARYILPYGLMILPYASGGISRILTVCSKTFAQYRSHGLKVPRG